MIELLGYVGVGLLVGGLAFVAGRASSRRGFWWSMENDPIERREVLEQLARLEGVTLEGRE